MSSWKKCCHQLLCGDTVHVTHVIIVWFNWYLHFGCHNRIYKYSINTKKVAKTCVDEIFFLWSVSCAYVYIRNYIFFCHWFSHMEPVLCATYVVLAGCTFVIHLIFLNVTLFILITFTTAGFMRITSTRLHGYYMFSLTCITLYTKKCILQQSAYYDRGI